MGRLKTNFKRMVQASVVQVVAIQSVGSEKSGAHELESFGFCLP